MMAESGVGDEGITPPRSVAAGDVVLSCEPWIWSFQPKYHQILCAQCFTEFKDLHSCSGCKLYRYCSAECQKANWKKEHKNECGMLKKLHEKLAKFSGSFDHDCSLERWTTNGCCTAQILIAKVMNKIKRAEKEEIFGMAQNMTVADVLEMLPCDPDSQHPIRSMSRAIGQPADLALYDLIWPAAKQTIPHFDQIVRKITYHAFPIQNQRGKTAVYGLGIFPQALYRSMTPVCWDMNVTMDFQGRMLVVRATEEISAYTRLSDLRQSELTPTFVDTLARRRERFKLIYGHACTCRKCSPEYEAEITPLKCTTRGCPARIPSDKRSLLPCPSCGVGNGERLNQLHDFVQTFNKAANGGANAMFGGLGLLGLIGELDTADIVHPDAHFRFVCGFSVAMILENMGNHRLAWKHCREFVECVRTVYPACHLNRARHLVKAGAIPYIWAHKTESEQVKRLQPVFDEALPEAMGWLKEAQSIYAKLGGEGSLWAQEVAKFIAHYGGAHKGNPVQKTYWDWTDADAVFKW